MICRVCTKDKAEEVMHKEHGKHTDICKLCRNKRQTAIRWKSGRTHGMESTHKMTGAKK